MNKTLKSILKYALYPFSLLYKGVTDIRNYLYDEGIYSSIAFDVPIVSVGNLSTGGTGKTPMVEFLIESFYYDYHMATLSRGYRRSTKGFRIADRESNARKLGDEPYQYYLKYPKVTVSVGEDRMIAIPLLLQQRPETELIILDDAYQHRSVRSGMNILLTRYDKPFWRDFPLPMGSLRESRLGASRADIIVITKCPDDIPQNEVEQIQKDVELSEGQKLYFAGLHYGKAYAVFDPQDTIDINNKDILAISGIADSKHFLGYLREKGKTVHPLDYKDHARFSLREIEDILETYNNMPANSIIVCTEKDAAKLVDFKKELSDYPLFALPVKTKILLGKEEEYRQTIKNYIDQNLKNGTEEIE